MNRNTCSQLQIFTYKKEYQLWENLFCLLGKECFQINPYKRVFEYLLSQNIILKYEIERFQNHLLLIYMHSRIHLVIQKILNIERICIYFSHQKAWTTVSSHIWSRLFSTISDCKHQFHSKIFELKRKSIKSLLI